MFVCSANYENILTTKISQNMVYDKIMNCTVMHVHTTLLVYIVFHIHTAIFRLQVTSDFTN